MKKPCFIFLPGIPVAVMGLIAVMTAFADDHVRSNALRIVDPYAGTWSSPPRLIATDQTTDAPLLGNGDVGVAITGTIDSHSFFLGKNEWWSLTQGNTQPLARVIVRIPKMKGAGYSMRQGLRCAECTGTFSTAGKKIEIQSWIAATDNLLVTRFVLTGDSAVPAAIALTDGYGKTDQAKTSVSADVASLDVAADNVDAYKGYPTRKARLSVKVVGATGTPGQGMVSFTLPPSGKDTIYIIIAIVSNTDAAQYQTASVDKIKSLTGVSVASLNDAHREWWAAYYGKSFIEIPDKTIEKYLYGSLYLLGCCMRGNEYPPGLWGNWAMKAMGWNGDFTLNYNYEAPFFGLYNLNHADIASCYEKPVLDWIPNGQSAAKNAGFSGLYYGVHIGPLPDGSADKNFWNQRSMTAFAAVPMLFHWFYTRDKTYAASVYDYLRQSALFWENYLQWDGSRYVIVNDAQHEGDPGPQTNGVMSLGLVRFLLQGAGDISAALGLDADKRTVWQNILSKLSAYPTFSHANPFTGKNQVVFRYTEVGRDWNGGNAIGCQNIYPASQIGLSSDSATLQIAWNMIDQMRRWDDGNGTNSFYPAAARVGYPADSILNHLKNFAVNNSYKNLHIHTGGGGIENLTPAPAGIAEMLMQSFQGATRLFSDWPKASYAKFGDLAAYGGFLVSSDYRAAAVQYARVVSLAGREFVLVNPWHGTAVQVYRNGNDEGTKTGNEVALSTAAGDTLHLAPKGVSLQTIRYLMAQPAGAVVFVRDNGRAAGPENGVVTTTFITTHISGTVVPVPLRCIGKKALVETYDPCGRLLARHTMTLGPAMSLQEAPVATAVRIVKVKIIKE